MLLDDAERFLAHLKDTKMDSKRKASVFDFWGGVAWLKKEVQGRSSWRQHVCEGEGDITEVQEADVMCSSRGSEMSL